MNGATQSPHAKKKLMSRLIVVYSIHGFIFLCVSGAPDDGGRDSLQDTGNSYCIHMASHPRRFF